jgi:hypothetical protein
MSQCIPSKKKFKKKRKKKGSKVWGTEEIKMEQQCWNRDSLERSFLLYILIYVGYGKQ